MAHLLNPFALVVSEVDSTEGTNLEEELAKFEANHEKDMIQFNESIAKLNDDKFLIGINQKLFYYFVIQKSVVNLKHTLISLF